jgi:hypothetical protein
MPVSILSLIRNEDKVNMFGFSTADWIFVVVVMFTIFICVGISDMRKKP